MVCETLLDDIKEQEFDMIALPGGNEGSSNLG